MGGDGRMAVLGVLAVDSASSRVVGFTSANVLAGDPEAGVYRTGTDGHYVRLGTLHRSEMPVDSAHPPSITGFVGVVDFDIRTAIPTSLTPADPFDHLGKVVVVLGAAGSSARGQVVTLRAAVELEQPAGAETGVFVDAIGIQLEKGVRGAAIAGGSLVVAAGLPLGIVVACSGRKLFAAPLSPVLARLGLHPLPMDAEFLPAVAEPSPDILDHGIIRAVRSRGGISLSTASSRFVIATRKGGSVKAPARGPATLPFTHLQSWAQTGKEPAVHYSRSGPVVYILGFSSNAPAARLDRRSLAQQLRRIVSGKQDDGRVRLSPAALGKLLDYEPVTVGKGVEILSTIQGALTASNMYGDVDGVLVDAAVWVLAGSSAKSIAETTSPPRNRAFMRAFASTVGSAAADPAALMALLRQVAQGRSVTAWTSNALTEAFRRNGQRLEFEMTGVVGHRLRVARPAKAEGVVFRELGSDPHFRWQATNQGNDIG